VWWTVVSCIYISISVIRLSRIFYSLRYLRVATQDEATPIVAPTKNIPKKKDGTVTLTSVKGYFKASPHNGKEVNPGQAPGGIAIPNPKGFDTDRATAKGTWKDGKLELDIEPKILPVVVKVKATK